MSDIISWIIIFICLVAVIFIAIRKFPQLAILDVENIPEEKVEKMKERLIKERLDRDFSQTAKKISAFWILVLDRFNFFSRWLESLKGVKNKIVQKNSLAKVGKKEKIEMHLKQAQEYMKKNDLESLAEAERELIEAVSLDQKYLPAFVALGDVYGRLKKYQEAKQSFVYAIRLLELNGDKKTEADVSYQLCLTNISLGLLDEAKINVVESLLLEPNNPRYLSTLLDIAIDTKDKSLAKEAWERLRDVNPDNQKLEEKREEVDNI
jgi:tetratricopeptide (TPR) repeat protein